MSNVKCTLCGFMNVNCLRELMHDCNFGVYEITTYTKFTQTYIYVHEKTSTQIFNFSKLVPKFTFKPDKSNIRSYVKRVKSKDMWFHSFYFFILNITDYFHAFFIHC